MPSFSNGQPPMPDGDRKLMIIERQDEQLGAIHSAVRSLRGIVEQSGQEVGENNSMLERLNEELETLQEKLHRNQRALQQYDEAAADRRFNWTFGVLIAMLIVALVILILL